MAISLVNSAIFSWFAWTTSSNYKINFFWLIPTV
jgi:hypothetical protein